MPDFTEDEIRCLKKLIYKVREEEILELYKKKHGNKNIFIRIKNFLLSRSK